MILSVLSVGRVRVFRFSGMGQTLCQFCRWVWGARIRKNTKAETVTFVGFVSASRAHFYSFLQGES